MIKTERVYEEHRKPRPREAEDNIDIRMIFDSTPGVIDLGNSG